LNRQIAMRVVSALTPAHVIAAPDGHTFCRFVSSAPDRHAKMAGPTDRSGQAFCLPSCSSLGDRR